MQGKVSSSSKSSQTKLFRAADEYIREDIDPTVVYLLFYAVLNSDLELAEYLLRSGVKPDQRLVFQFLEDIDSKHRDGFLSRKELKSKYDYYMKHRNTNLEKPHLLELVCLNKSGSRRKEMLQLLISHHATITIAALVHLICNPMADKELWKLMVQEGCQSAQNTLGCWPCKKLTFTTLYLAIFEKLGPDIRNTPPGQRHPLVYVMESIIDAQANLENDNSVQTINDFCFGALTAANLRESFLLQAWLKAYHLQKDKLLNEDAITNEDYIDFLHRLIGISVASDAYYCMHIVCQLLHKFPRSMRRLHVPLEHPVAESKVFSAHYLMQQELKDYQGPPEVKYKIPVMPICYKHIPPANPLILWLLLTRGEEANQSLSEGESLLGSVARHNATMGVELLIKHYDVDVNKRNHFIGLTPIFNAVQHHNLKMVRILLRANCDMDIEFLDPSRSHTSPAAHALYWGHYDTLQILLAAGAKTPRKAYSQLSPYAHYDEEDTPYKESRQWIVDWLQAPQPLRYQCRRFIRRYMGANKFEKKLKQLDYPLYLKEFLTTERLF